MTFEELKILKQKDLLEVKKFFTVLFCHLGQFIIIILHVPLCLQLILFLSSATRTDLAAISLVLGEIGEVKGRWMCKMNVILRL